MKISKQNTPGVCRAKRCTEAAVDEAIVDGEEVALCARHLEEHLATAQSYVEVAPVANDPLLSLADELAAETADAQDTLALIMTQGIQTQDDLEFIAEILQDVKGRKKRLEERMREITQPMNVALKSTRDLFRPALEAFAQAEIELKTKIADAKKREEQDTVEAVEQLDLARVRHTANVEGLRTRQVWAFRVVAPEKVPRELCVVSDKLIREYIREYHGEEPSPVPGIEFFTEVAVASIAK